MLARINDKGALEIRTERAWTRLQAVVNALQMLRSLDHSDPIKNYLTRVVADQAQYYDKLYQVSVALPHVNGKNVNHVENPFVVKGGE